ncbi:unnamed protein product [Ambrosiozyma monospora]|uniref:Unnamed protein product n=1 Tax=Ambrosiozyma monospora TaxID=43982 RepID=A0ACB5SX29_AMBMO|nr:unnamed protein product [Ambrosiozyma monospora]
MFWKNFISPLDGSLTLNLSLDILKSELIVDEMPPHLASLSISYRERRMWFEAYDNELDSDDSGLIRSGSEVVLHGIPKSLGYLKVEGSGSITLKKEVDKKTLILSCNEIDGIEYKESLNCTVEENEYAWHCMETVHFLVFGVWKLYDE